jgi:hypothetical protein
VRTSRLVQVGQVREVVAGLEHGRVHQRRQVRVVARLDAIDRGLDRLGLRSASSVGVPYALPTVPTSPFSSLNTSFTLSPAICLSETSEATQPSVVSGCHARVPMS